MAEIRQQDLKLGWVGQVVSSQERKGMEERELTPSKKWLLEQKAQAIVQEEAEKQHMGSTGSSSNFDVL